MAEARANTRDRLRHVQHLRFVGRRAEQQAFLDYALTPVDPVYTIYAFNGIGGIGKTSLLAELELLARLRTPHVSGATLETVHSPLDLMRTWRSTLPGKAFRKFDREMRRFTGVASKLHTAAESLGAGTLNALANGGTIGAFVAGAVGEERLRAFLAQYLSGREANIYLDGMATLTKLFAEGCDDVARVNRVFLFLDYFEAATAEVDDWLRRFVGGDISTEIVFVLAGREPLRRVNPAWVTLGAICYESELPLLSELDVAEYFTRVGINDMATRRQISSLAKGLPWALALSAETAAHGGLDTAGSPGRGDVQSMVVSRFLSQLGEESTELRHAVEAAALVAWFDEDLVRCLVPLSEDFSVESMSRYSFISVREDGKYAMRDAVREAVAEGVKLQREARWRQMHRLAADYHRRLTEEAEPLSTAWRRHFLEVIRHTLVIDPIEAMEKFAGTVERFPVHVWVTACGQALQLLDSHSATSDEPYILLASAEMLLTINDLDSARERFHQTTRVAAESWSRLRAYAGLVDIAHRVGGIRESLQLSLTAHSLAEESGSHRDAAIFSARAAEMSGSMGDEGGVDRYVAQAASHVERCADPFAAGQARLLMAHTQIFAGRYREGGTQLTKALEQWNRAGHAFGVAQVHSAQAWVGWLTEQIAMGMRSARLAMEYFEDAQDRYSYGLSALNLAELYRCSGHPNRSIQWNRTAAQRFAETGGVLYHAIAQYRLGRAQLDAGHLDEAVASLETSIRLQEESVGEKYSHGMALLYLAEALITGGRQNAGMIIDRAEEMLCGAQNRHGRAWAPVAVTVLIRRLDPASETGERLALGLRLAREAGFWDIVAQAEAETVLRRWQHGHSTGLGTGAVDAIAAAARHGPYCADRLTGQLEPLLRALDVEERRSALQHLGQITRQSTPSSDPFAMDSRRRAEERLRGGSIAGRVQRILLPA